MHDRLTTGINNNFAFQAPVSQVDKVLHLIKMPGNQVLRILQTDIVQLSVDAVVNPTNDTLYMGGMVGSRLMAVGGAAFAQIMADARRDNTLTKLDGIGFAPLAVYKLYTTYRA